ncbi:MAG TPA: hypothetical protein VGM73_08145 [Candidatus Didemnitutus sp.]|jgi:hypothetical protein
MNLLDLSTWPRDVLDCLRQHQSLLLEKELRDQSDVQEKLASYKLSREDQIVRQLKAYENQFDPAPREAVLDDLIQILSRHTLLGYHCARLTEKEIANILAEGMGLPQPSMLLSRIRAASEDGLIPKALARRLALKHDAANPRRKGKIWFCFYPPRPAGEAGIGSLLRYWGGEALYNSWFSDETMSALLQGVGLPAVVEADVPAIGLSKNSFLGDHLARQYLLHKGYEITEPAVHEGFSERPLPASAIRRIHRFPERDFRLLTGCEAWRAPLDRISPPIN